VAADLALRAETSSHPEVARAGFGCLGAGARRDLSATARRLEIALEAAAPGKRRRVHRRAGAAAHHRQWTVPRRVPLQAFRRVWPKGRRCGAWNLTRDRVSARIAFCRL